MKTQGQRIKERRKELGLTQKALGKSVGVSHVTISQWEKNETSPKGNNLIALSKALNSSSAFIVEGKAATSSAPAIQDAEWLGTFEPWGSNTGLQEDEVDLPFFTEVELAAGDGSTQVQENHGPKLRFARSTLQRHGVEVNNAACVKVSGTSMEPVLPDGATIGVDTSKIQIVDGKMFAIDHDGMLRVKVLYRLPGNGIRLRSFNSDEYPDETYHGDELQQIRVIGKVFWYSVLV